MLYWYLLVGAILFEVAGTLCMKLSNGFERVIPALLMGLFYIISLTLLAYSLKRLDLSVAYAIWAGVGTMLISVIGVVYFKESLSLMKLFGIFFIVAGVVLLNLSTQKIAE